MGAACSGGSASSSAPILPALAHNDQDLEPMAVVPPDPAPAPAALRTAESQPQPQSQSQPSLKPRPPQPRHSHSASATVSVSVSVPIATLPAPASASASQPQSQPQSSVRGPARKPSTVIEPLGAAPLPASAPASDAVATKAELVRLLRNAQSRSAALLESMQSNQQQQQQPMRPPQPPPQSQQSRERRQSALSEKLSAMSHERFSEFHSAATRHRENSIVEMRQRIGAPNAAGSESGSASGNGSGAAAGTGAGSGRASGMDINNIPYDVKPKVSPSSQFPSIQSNSRAAALPPSQATPPATLLSGSVASLLQQSQSHSPPPSHPYRPSTLAASGQLVLGSRPAASSHHSPAPSISLSLGSYRSTGAQSGSTPSAHMATLNSGLNSLMSELRSSGGAGSSDLALSAMSGAVADAKALVLLEDQRQKQRKLERELLRHQFKANSATGMELMEKQKQIDAMENKLEQISNPEVEELKRQIAVASGREKELLVKRLEITERIAVLKAAQSQKNRTINTMPAALTLGSGGVTSPLGSFKSRAAAHHSAGPVAPHSHSHSPSTSQMGQQEILSLLKAAVKAQS